MDIAKIQTLQNETTKEPIAPRTHLNAVSGTGKKGQVVGFTADNVLGVMDAPAAGGTGDGGTAAPAEHNHDDLYYTKEQADAAHQQLKTDLETKISEDVNAAKSEMEGSVNSKLENLKDEIEDAIKEGGGFSRIYLPAPTGITITNMDEGCEIKWTDPEDVLLPGSSGILAKWAGTVVIRKPDAPPTNQNDGTVVGTSTMRDQYKESGLMDDGLENGRTYYYGIFPFSTDEVYTVEAVQSFVPQPILPEKATELSATNLDEAIELTFNNPMYPDYPRVKVVYKAGSAPKDSEDGTAVTHTCSAASGNKVTINGLSNDTQYYFVVFTSGGRREAASDPLTFTPTAIYPAKPTDVTITNGVLAATISFTPSVNATRHTIVYKSGSSPVSETDGTSVDAASSPVKIEGLSVGVTYYFRVYAHNAKRAAGADAVSITAREAEHYAFTINDKEAVCKSKITYPADADNASFAAAGLSGSAFSYGGWAEAFFIKKLRVVMLNFDGSEAYEIDKNNYKQKAAGGAVGTEGNVMVAIPKIYFKVVDNGNDSATYHFSDVALDSDYKCWAHIGIDGKEQDVCYMAAYDPSCTDNTKLRSLTGQAPMVNQNADTEITRAKANNLSGKNNWYTGVLADRLLIQLLLLLIGKNTNTQEQFGYGYANGNSAAINSGTMDDKGLFWGETGGKQGVKVFGIENFWGNVYNRIAGWMCVNTKQMVKLTYGTEDGSSVTGYNTTGNGYVDMGALATSSFWIKTMHLSKFGLLPKAGTGSETTDYADHCYLTSSGTYYAFVGGYWDHGTHAGAFYVALFNAPSNTSTSIGASLSYKKG